MTSKFALTSVIVMVEGTTEVTVKVIKSVTVTTCSTLVVKVMTVSSFWKTVLKAVSVAVGVIAMVSVVN